MLEFSSYLEDTWKDLKRKCCLKSQSPHSGVNLYWPPGWCIETESKPNLFIALEGKYAEADKMNQFVFIELCSELLSSLSCFCFHTMTSYQFVYVASSMFVRNPKIESSAVFSTTNIIKTFFSSRPPAEASKMKPENLPTDTSTTESSRMTIPESASDFNQWLQSMLAVARLPGGLPIEFRRKVLNC